MTEIQAIEAEIAEKKALLLKLKKEKRRDSHLSYEKYNNMLGKRVYIDSYYNNAMYITMRNFVTMWMNAMLARDSRGEIIKFPKERLSISAASAEQMRICNDFLDELHPIVSKYVHIFLNHNLREELNGQ